MDTHSPDSRIRIITGLTKSEGWTEFLLPEFKKRREAIKNSLVSNLPPEETSRLRIQHDLLLELERLPSTAMQLAKGGLNSTP